jgi:hypothetical protein
MKFEPSSHRISTYFNINGSQRVHVWGFYCVHLIFLDFVASISSIALIFAYDQNIVQPFSHAYDRKRFDDIVDEIVPALRYGKVTSCKYDLS